MAVSDLCAARFCIVCGEVIRKTDGDWDARYATRVYCSLPCVWGHRRAQPCRKCVERECCAGQDWRPRSTRGRECRCCKNRARRARRAEARGTA